MERICGPAEDRLTVRGLSRAWASRAKAAAAAQGLTLGKLIMEAVDDFLSQSDRKDQTEHAAYSMSQSDRKNQTKQVPLGWQQQVEERLDRLEARSDAMEVAINVTGHGLVTTRNGAPKTGGRTRAISEEIRQQIAILARQGLGKRRITRALMEMGIVVAEPTVEKWRQRALAVPT